MDTIHDLEIDNYNLTDLLNLFHLKYDFTELELKKAKRMVLKMHPDKSNIDIYTNGYNTRFRNR